MRLFYFKGTFYSIRVIKEKDELVFKTKLFYFYDMFCWDIIKMDYQSSKYTLSNVKEIQSQIINKLNETFR